mgnify:CR=1 FL=1
MNTINNAANAYRLAGQVEKDAGNFMAAEWYFEQADKISFEVNTSFADTVVSFLVNSSRMEELDPSFHLEFCEDFKDAEFAAL